MNINSCKYKIHVLPKNIIMDQFAFFYMWLPVEPTSFVENAVFFLLDVFSSFVKDQVSIGVWVNFSVFNSIKMIFLPVSIPIPRSDIDSPWNIFIVENRFWYPEVFYCKWICKLFFLSSMKNWVGILMGIELNL